MDSTTWVQILIVAVGISHSKNTLGKGMSPAILSSAMGKIVGQIVSFNLDTATGLGEGIQWIQTSCKLGEGWASQVYSRQRHST